MHTFLLFFACTRFRNARPDRVCTHRSSGRSQSSRSVHPYSPTVLRPPRVFTHADVKSPDRFVYGREFRVFTDFLPWTRFAPDVPDERTDGRRSFDPYPRRRYLERNVSSSERVKTVTRGLGRFRVTHGAIRLKFIASATSHTSWTFFLPRRGTRRFPSWN